MDEGSKTELRKLAVEYVNKAISIERAKRLFLAEAMTLYSQESDEDRQVHHEEALSIFEEAFTKLFVDATA
jgi:hypothetical protein